MFATDIRQCAEVASRAALPALASRLWKGFVEGQVSEAEAGVLIALIEAREVVLVAGASGLRNEPAVQLPPLPIPDLSEGLPNPEQAPQDRSKSPGTGTGSRPRTSASLERRRLWAASGRIPPALAKKFTLAEQATLAVVAAETAKKGDCRLSIPHLAAVAGVSQTMVRTGIREARILGLLTVEQRRVSNFRNLPNVVRIVSPEWTAWLRLARKEPTDRDSLGRPGRGMMKRPAPAMGGGCKFPNRTNTQVPKQKKKTPHRVPKGGIAPPIPPPHATSRKAGA